jgi:hypothetical protein
VLAVKYGFKDRQMDSRENIASNLWKVVHTSIRCEIGTEEGRWWEEDFILKGWLVGWDSS